MRGIIEGELKNKYWTIIKNILSLIRNSFTLVGWYSTTHVHTLLCMDPGGVQTAGIQWDHQSFHQCRVRPRHRNHLDG